MRYCIFGCVILFYFIVCFKVSSGKKKMITLSVKGAKDVPIRGLLLGDHIKNSDVETLRKAVENNKNRLLGLETKIKALQHQTKPTQGQNEVYYGCFKDDGSRHLKHKITNMGSSITLAKCKTHCKGYKYLGLQASDWCGCGNELFNKNYPLVSDAECNMNCKGEPKIKCGGGWRNSIYLDSE